MKTEYTINLCNSAGRWEASVQVEDKPVPTFSIQTGATASIALENLAFRLREIGL